MFAGEKDLSSGEEADSESGGEEEEGGGIELLVSGKTLQEVWLFHPHLIVCIYTSVCRLHSASLLVLGNTADEHGKLCCL